MWVGRRKVKMKRLVKIIIIVLGVFVLGCIGGKVFRPAVKKDTKN